MVDRFIIVSTFAMTGALAWQVNPSLNKNFDFCVLRERSHGDLPGVSFSLCGALSLYCFSILLFKFSIHLDRAYLNMIHRLSEP